MKESHKFCSIFPLMDGGSYEKFRDDLAENGQRHPIVLFQGKILDGRNRYRALKSIGLDDEDIAFEDFEGSEADAASYAFSANAARRHLSEGQLAAIAVEFREMCAEHSIPPPKVVRDQATQAGLKKTHREVEEPEKKPDIKDPPHISQRALGKAFGISQMSVNRAEKIHRNGTEELWKAVKDNRITIAQAGRLTKLPPREQDEAVKRLLNGDKDVAPTNPVDAIMRAVKTLAAAELSAIKRASHQIDSELFTELRDAVDSIGEELEARGVPLNGGLRSSDIPDDQIPF